MFPTAKNILERSEIQFLSTEGRLGLSFAGENYLTERNHMGSLKIWFPLVNKVRVAKYNQDGLLHP